MRQASMLRIFVSYRRQDSAGHAGRLFDRLVAHFGRDSIFMDVDAIGGGVDFVDSIHQAVGACDVFLPLIGPAWLEARSGESRRLDQAEDYVRAEIAAALERGVPTIPVLVDGALMPGPAELPPELAPLARRNAVELTDSRWEYDCSRLVEAIELHTGPRPQEPAAPRPRRATVYAAAVALAALVVAAGWWAVTRPPPTAGVDAAGAAETPGADLPLVAVAPLANLAGEEELAWYGDGIAGLVRQQLSRSRRLVVVSSARMQRLQQKAAESSLLDAMAGDGVGYLVSGEFFPAGEGYTLTVRLTETARGTDVAVDSWSTSGPSGLLEASARIVALAKRGLDLPHTEEIDLYSADFAIANPAAYEAYVAGLEAFTAFRYAEAEAQFALAVELAPGFAMARYRLAHAQAAAGRREEAVRTIRQVDTESPGIDDRDRRYLRAAEAWFSGRYDEAVDEYDALLADYPHETEALFQLATVLFGTRRYPEAVARLKALSRLEPESRYVWSLLGASYFEMRRFDRATAAFERYAELDPGSATTLNTLGELYSRQGRFEAAAESYRRALETEPDFHPAAVGLAQLKALRSEPSAAETRLKELIADADVPPRWRIDAAFELCHLRRAQGRFSSAGEALESLEEEVRQERVREAMALAFRGLSRLEAGDAESARQLIHLSIERAPGSATRYLFARGLLELAEGRLDDALATADSIRREEPNPSADSRKEERAAAYLRGMARLAEGRAAEAVVELERAVELSGYPYAVYRLGLARALAAADRLPEALAAARQAGERDLAELRMDLELDHRRALLVQAEIHAALGDRRRAADLARSFLEHWSEADRGVVETGLAKRLAAG